MNKRTIVENVNNKEKRVKHFVTLFLKSSKSLEPIYGYKEMEMKILWHCFF